MTLQPAARVSDPFGHTLAFDGALAGLTVGALLAVMIVATGGLGAIAIGAAFATAGGIGLAGEAIGQTIQGSPSGQLLTGSYNVLINGLPATMVALSQGACSQHGAPRAVATGASGVWLNGKPIARVGEKMDCSAVILSGSPNVLIGGNSQQYLPMTPEVPRWLNMTMMTMAIGGTIVATAGVAAEYGIPVAVGGVIGGLVGSYVGDKAFRSGAKALGLGVTDQEVAGVLGGFAGGGLFGAAGGKIGINSSELYSKVFIDSGTFRANGLSKEQSLNYLETDDGKLMLNDLKTSDPAANDETIVQRALTILNTGKDIPTIEIKSDPLYKIVPQGNSVSPYSPFFTSMDSLNKASYSDGNLSDLYGLPKISMAQTYDIYQITPTKPTNVFTSVVADTKEFGGMVNNPGGAEQSLVLNRSQWSQPTLIGQIADKGIK